jgi:hypothetical protein
MRACGGRKSGLDVRRKNKESAQPDVMHQISLNILFKKKEEEEEEEKEVEIMPQKVTRYKILRDVELQKVEGRVVSVMYCNLPGPTIPYQYVVPS